MTRKRLKLNAYGRIILLEFINGEWIAFFSGNEGKKRRVPDLSIPDNLGIQEVVTYVADMLHEYATEMHQSVEVLED